MDIREALGRTIISICRPEAALRADIASLALTQGNRVVVSGVDISEVLARTSFIGRVQLLTWLAKPVIKSPTTETHIG
jgi:hypothetical protein